MNDRDGAWSLPAHRATVPAPVNGHLPRPALVKRCVLTQRPLTLLRAPAGFGKTVLLAECCRRLAGEGVTVAWLTLDERDDPWRLIVGLGEAFRRSGLDVVDVSDVGAAWRGAPGRLEGLRRAVEAHGGPCVLALDEAERLQDPGAIDLLNELAAEQPRGLHLAVACREPPPGLDLQGLVPAGEDGLFTAEDLRFSKEEVATFFGGTLSDRELSGVARDCDGWPAAVRFRKAVGTRSTSLRVEVVAKLADSWIEASLLSHLAESDREFLLDVGLLDWVDAELLDEALAGDGLLRRLEALPGISDLLEAARGAGTRTWRLPRLIREHCVERRRRETPDRYRAIHRRAAAVLGQRGQTTEAVRHAAEAGDPALAADMLLQAGGVRLWLLGGAGELLRADRLMDRPAVDAHERLALVRAVSHASRGSSEKAMRWFENAIRQMAAEGPGVDTDLDIDRCLTWGALTWHGLESLGSRLAAPMIAETQRLAETPELDPPARATLQYVLAFIHGQRAEFDRAREQATRARPSLVSGARVSGLLELELGQAAMAQGRPEDAADAYARVRSTVRTVHPDPECGTLADILTRELDLERGDAGHGNDQWLVGQVGLGALPFVGCAALSSATVEVALHMSGVDVALSAVDEICEEGRRRQMSPLVCCLDAHRVAVLAAGGHVGEAESHWRTSLLPNSTDGCLDLAGQSWREMEVLACARLRLLIARGDLEAARRLVHDAIGVTSARGLQRTSMRVLALAIALEDEAGDRAAAKRHLATFLESFVRTDYAWAVVRDRDAALPLLREFVDEGSRPPLRRTAEGLLERIGALPVPAPLRS